MKHLIISTPGELVRVSPMAVMYFSSDGNYSTIVQADGELRTVSFQLGQIERLIADQLGREGNAFVRIGRNLIINREYIYYIHVSKQKLILSDGRTVAHTLTASREALRALKELVEKDGL